MFDWLWSEWFWLKPGITWDDLKPEEGILKAQAEDLFMWPFVIAAALLFFRNCILLPFVLTPIGKHYGVRSKPYNPPAPNDKLEQLYKVNRARPPRELLKHYALEVGWEERRVERWLRQKTLSNQEPTFVKFNDYGYQFVYYTCIFIFGLYAVVTEPFFWDTEKCFEDYPRTSVSKSLWWYNMTCLGFYVLQIVLVFTHSRRHDFVPMVCHHVIAIAMVSGQWATNFPRLNGIGLVVHEFVDLFIGLAKCFNYCGRLDIANMLGIPFVIFWILTRCILYPLHVMRTAIFVTYRLYGVVWPFYLLHVVFSLLLLGLHINWTMDMVPIITALFKNETAQDISSPEELSEDEVHRNENRAKKIN